MVTTDRSPVATATAPVATATGGHGGHPPPFLVALLRVERALLLRPT